jgi:hypothetical protein
MSLDKSSQDLIRAIGELKEVLKKNIESQKRLERTQNCLALVGVAIALLQLVGMFVV